MESVFFLHFPQIQIAEEEKMLFSGESYKNAPPFHGSWSRVGVITGNRNRAAIKNTLEESFSLTIKGTVY